MMTQDQQTAFEQTREKIRINMAEIAALSRTFLAPGEYFARFLGLVTDSLQARGGVVWSVTPEGGFQAMAVDRFDSVGYGSNPRQKGWIEAVLRATRSTGRPHIVAADDPTQPAREIPEGEIGNSVPYPIFYQPVGAPQSVSAVLQVWLPTAGDPRTYNDITAFLSQLCAYAETYLRGWQGAQLAARNDLAQVMLRMQSELVGELDPKIIQSTAANYLLDLLRADLACVFQKKRNHWVLVSASNQEAVDPKSVQSLALRSVAEALTESQEGAICAADSAEGDLPKAMSSCGMLTVSWSHFVSSANGPVDRLIMAARNDGEAFGQDAVERVRWTATQLAKALDAATHFQSLPLRPLVVSGGRMIRAWRQNRRRRVLMVTLPVLLFAGAMFVPIPWKLGADCQVTPSRTATVVAETSSKVVEVLVREGDKVAEGQLLARLDDTDFATQIAISTQQMLRWQVEVGKAQTLGNEAERKIAELSVAREQEALRRYEYLRSRTELRSPIAGTVLTRNLHNLVGQAVEVGRPFCEIAGEGSYELVLDIKQPDLGDVLGALESGEALPVDFILHPHPMVSLATTLIGANSVSQLPELRHGKSVFLARAPFPEDSELDELLKPGFTGKAKLSMGRRAAGWVLARPFWNYVRSNWTF
ncbi:MAG: hypothetical protein Fur0032_03810 [Terrimicrobiaceae bacterium]